MAVMTVVRDSRTTGKENQMYYEEGIDEYYALKEQIKEVKELSKPEQKGELNG